MRAIYLLQTAIFAFLTVVAKESYLYIYVADDLKNNVLVIGQTYTTGTTIYQSSYNSDLYDRCLNKTETGLNPFKSPECKNQPLYACITMIYLEAVDNKPKHLDIVMPKYNLSVRYKTYSRNACADIAVRVDLAGGSLLGAYLGGLGNRIRPLYTFSGSGL